MNIKPTALHEATGALKKNPNRKRKGEVRPRKGIGSAPPAPSSDFAEIWDEIVDSVIPGVLGNCDRQHLEILCRLMAEFRADPQSMSSAKLSMIEKMLGKLGMNPIDRIRITVPEDEVKSKEDAYF